MDGNKINLKSHDVFLLYQLDCTTHCNIFSVFIGPFLKLVLQRSQDFG